MSEKNFSFIIVAGGKGSRMGGERKQFSILDGKPLWKWSADKANELNEFISEIILVIPSDYDEKILPDENYKIPLKIIKGGSERAESVLNGLKASECEYVLVHDAARPFASKNLFLSLMAKTENDVGVVPVLPVSDALKRIDDEKISCVEREGLYITQTPQSFHREKLINAVTKNLKAKDEAEAWENFGLKLDYVKGEKLNFKITFQDDMLIAKSLVNNKIIRTGIGYDVHRLVPERKLILGGVKIQDSNLGLLGHSDADILTHAIMDSILGAAGLEDIGNIFSADDEKFKGADSMKLLEEVMKLVKAEGWKVEFVDAVVEAQVPRLNKYKPAIKNNLGKFFDVNIKFKSPEEIDDAGRGLAMKCRAVATLIKEL
mgnify:CR=1 FL=1